MSSTTWWILASTVPIAILITIISIIVMRVKISKIKSMHEDENNKKLDFKIREDVGELLWDLKEKTKNPLDDFSMEFAINTSIRNKYKTFYIEGFESEYEEENLKQLANLKKVKKNYNFFLINFDSDFINKISNIYNEMNNNSLIMIVNIESKKERKEFISYLKLIGIRNEEQKIGKGIILIAK